jgi:adenylosuccinate synthase
LLDELPVDPEDIQIAQPVYEELPGWSVAAEGRPQRALGDLPPAAQRYVARISELVGLPLSFISVGPGREETIVQGSLFGGRT